MSKHKWQSKLVNLAVAFALVFSLAGIALLPVASPVLAGTCRVFLVANITAPADDSTVSSGQDFNLTFTIKNTGNCTASNVMGLVTVSAGAHVVTQPVAKPSLAVNATASFTAKLHCDEVGFVVIHVDPVGYDTCLKHEIDEGCTISSLVGIRQVFSVDCDAEPNPTKVCHNVTFTATVGEEAVGPVSWVWDFGDGDSASGSTSESEFSVQHHYNSTGTKEACVNVTDASDPPITVMCCADVVVYPTLGVSCNATPNPTKEDHDVDFTADRVGGIPSGPDCSYSWFWDFDDGTNSAEQNPTHAYSTAGTYNATVTLTDDCGIDPANVATCNQTITVNPALNVTCAADPLETKVCHNITFTGTISGGVGPYTWTWDYGDLGSDSGMVLDPGTVIREHHYDEGTWEACFSVIDDLGNEEECCVTVKVHPPLSVSCNATPEVSPVCHNVTFSATREGGVPGDPYSWLWVFGDGFTSTSQNVSRAYMCVGNYTATVTVTDDLLKNTANCTANVTVTIFPPQLISPPNGVTVPSGEEVCFEWEDIGCCNYTLEVWQKEADGQKIWLVQTGH
ncbi:MAG: PKD domain-containing protein, partial [Dehalococcoidia bacterium]|nr:PKD domain-containing protein [Dehalococcoidia bacterium]